MIKNLSQRELEWMELQEIMYGAIDQNAVICNNCNSISHFLNNAVIRNCLFFVDKCDLCLSLEINR